ncbi:putative quinol monooxygenase [Sphingobium fluviale]|jgi:quinol monooxygenase YgiN|uniref:Antibiotic biosynthesis monooxygenase n=1 Tax=Sphingobium fluviale TaxID=2506423 RepID=A0A4Q1KMN2_9SPHN|nr:putative quinol monooxygenase [Sphingobium fluviale]RXR30785.1 antibiotic biosynthesis monooxygenase [Sphingobium fluviale]
MKIVIARAQVRPDMREKFLEAAMTCIAATRREPGCIAYDMYESVTGAGCFVAVEQWDSEAAIDAHFLCPHTTAFLEAAAQCVSEPPLIEEYETGERRVR